MEDIFTFVRWRLVPVYLENVMIFSKSPTSRNEQAQHVLGLLDEANGSLKPKKGKFFSEIIASPGQKFQRGRLEHTGYTTDAAIKLEHVTTPTELCFFWDFVTFLAD